MIDDSPDVQRGSDGKRPNGRNEPPVSGDELARQVPGRLGMGLDREPPQVAAEVGGELVGRGIAQFRLNAECLGHDQVEISDEAPA